MQEAADHLLGLLLPLSIVSGRPVWLILHDPFVLLVLLVLGLIGVVGLDLLGLSRYYRLPGRPESRRVTRNLPHVQHMDL